MCCTTIYCGAYNLKTHVFVKKHGRHLLTIPIFVSMIKTSSYMTDGEAKRGRPRGSVREYQADRLGNLVVH